MIELTDVVNDASKGVEVFWYKQNFKVIMFVDGDPVSFVSLDENTVESAKRASYDLINGGGTKL